MKKSITFLALSTVLFAPSVYAQDLDISATPEIEIGVGSGGSMRVDAAVDASIRGGEELNNNSDQGTTSAETSESNQHSREKSDVRGNAVSVTAVEVRGWDAAQKQEFLAAVKTHAAVQSEQDLKNFAMGVLVKNDHVAEVASNEQEVRVVYRVPARFLGIFETTLPATVTVAAASEDSLQATFRERVQVHFPWLRVFFSVPEEVKKEKLQAALAAHLETALRADATFELAEQARISQGIAVVLKNKQEVVIAGMDGVE